MADRRARVSILLLLLAGAGAGCGDDNHQQNGDGMAVMSDDGGDGAAAEAGPGDTATDQGGGDAKLDVKPDTGTDTGADRPDAKPDGGGDAADARDGSSDAQGDGMSMEVGVTCTDQVKNGSETDVDCGGTCGRCALHKHCAVNADCDSGACGTGGTCVECLTPTTCPGQDSECSHRTCEGGTCGVASVAAGPLATQTAGDCVVRRCDGVGGVLEVVDRTDTPDDGNACTENVCAADGSPSNPPVASGTSCGGAKVCDGQGHCVGCVTASDCPGTDNDCRTRTCTGGVCGFDFKSAGTAAGTQTAGDCKVTECDGNGGTRVSPLDSDLPDDGDPCTLDRCSGGVPSHAPAGSGTACGTGRTCDGASHCVQCTQAATCPGEDNVCQTRTCGSDGACGFARVAAGTPLPDQTAGDCQAQQCDGLGHLVNVADPGDLPNDGNPCTDDVCASGVPMFPPSAPGTPCGGNRTCDGTGRCIECVTAADCPGEDNACQTRTCSAAGICGLAKLASGTPIVAQAPGDCHVVVCDANATPISIVDDTDVRVDGNVCTDDLCTDGVPSNPPLAPETSCGGSNICDGAGHCFGCLIDADCPGDNTECQTQVCGTDFQCAVHNTDAGTLVSAQPAGDCRVAQCDGQGNVVQNPDDADLPVDGNACTQDVCTAGVPSNTPLGAGAACGGTNICDGFGSCFNGTRPQLSAAQAANFTILGYLAKTGSLVNGLTTDNWNPTAGVGDVATFVPDFVVQAGGPFPTVQSAVTAAVGRGGTTRLFIQIMPGTYREPVCVRSTSNTPITIYSTSPNAADTVIAFNNWAGLASTSTPNVAACAAPGATTFGTSASATFAIFSRDVQLKNLSLVNDFDETTTTSGNVQAVALETQGDKLIFENVRMLGNQDTLYVKSGNVDTVTRNYFKGCYVEGDVDAIFGRGVLVMDQSEIRYVSNRRGPLNGGDLISPSTDVRNPFGQLFINSMFTADAGTAGRTVSVGRAWDEGISPGAYPPATGTFPNGQAVIRNSVIGPHIVDAAPWAAAASTNRPYSFLGNPPIPPNRLFEFANTGPGSAGAGAGTAPTTAAVQAILNTNCTGCHSGATPPQGLALTNVRAVIGTFAAECTTKRRIASGSSAASYLVDKVLGTAQDGGCFAGVRMPRNQPALAATDIATIAAWIDAGTPP